MPDFRVTGWMDWDGNRHDVHYLVGPEGQAPQYPPEDSREMRGIQVTVTDADTNEVIEVFWTYLYVELESWEEVYVFIMAIANAEHGVEL